MTQSHIFGNRVNHRQVNGGTLFRPQRGDENVAEANLVLGIASISGGTFFEMLGYRFAAYRN
jgi:hypothetical protein